jgi:hypothetical protein
MDGHRKHTAARNSNNCPSTRSSGIPLYAHTTASTPAHAASRAATSWYALLTTKPSSWDAILASSLEGVRPRPRTVWPRVIRAGARFCPMWPVMPATRTSIVGVGLRVEVLKPWDGMQCGESVVDVLSFLLLAFSLYPPTSLLALHLFSIRRAHKHARWLNLPPLSKRMWCDVLPGTHHDTKTESW